MDIRLCKGKDCGEAFQAPPGRGGNNAKYCPDCKKKRVGKRNQDSREGLVLLYQKMTHKAVCKGKDCGETFQTEPGHHKQKYCPKCKVKKVSERNPDSYDALAQTPEGKKQEAKRVTTFLRRKKLASTYKDILHRQIKPLT